MKPITKKILIGAAIAVVVGSIICAVVFAVVGWNIGVSYIPGEGFAKTFEEAGQSAIYDIEAVTDIEIKADARKVKLIESDKFAVEYVKTSKIDHSVENGKLTVIAEEYRGNLGANIVGFGGGINRGDIKVYYPKGSTFTMVNINSDLGEIDIKNLNAKSINLKLGMGRCNIAGVKSDDLTIDSDKGSVDIIETVVENSGEIDLDMGSLTIKDSNFNNTELICDLGSINVKGSNLNNSRLDTDSGSTNFSDGTLTGITQVESSMGAVNIKINGSREDYIVSADVDLGSTNIKGKNPATAPNSIDIKSDLGAVNVSFK